MLISFSLFISEEGFLDNMIVLPFWGNFDLFSIKAMAIYIPTNTESDMTVFSEVLNLKLHLESHQEELLW